TVLGGLSPGRSVRGGAGKRLVQLDRSGKVAEVTSVRVFSETTKRPISTGDRDGMTHAIEPDGSEHKVLLRSRCPRCHRDVQWRQDRAVAIYRAATQAGMSEFDISRT